MLRHKAASPVRCSSRPNMIECASNNNKNCLWGKYKKQAPYTLVKGVKAKRPYMQFNAQVGNQMTDQMLVKNLVVTTIVN